MGIRDSLYVVQYYEPGMSGQAGYSHFCSDCYEEAQAFALSHNVPMLEYSYKGIVEGEDRPAPGSSCKCYECGEWQDATTSTLRKDGWLCADCLGRKEVVFGVHGAKTIEDFEAAVDHTQRTVAKMEDKIPVMKISAYDFSALAGMNVREHVTAKDVLKDPDEVEGIKVVSCLHGIFSESAAESHPMSNLIVFGDLPPREFMNRPWVVRQIGDEPEVTRFHKPEKPVDFVRLNNDQNE